MRWLAGNGADTALDGLRRVQAKAVCALTPHPPHSRTLARRPSRGAQPQQLGLVDDLHAELPHFVQLGAGFRASDDVIGFLADTAAGGSTQARYLSHLRAGDTRLFAMRAFRPFNRPGIFHVLDRLADRA